MSDTITANNAVNMPKELAIEKTFQPTPHMIVWLDTAVELGTDNKSLIEEKCKVSRNNWYNWLEISGFEDWYFEEYKKKRRRWLPKLDEIGLANSKRDYNFWKDMRKAAGDTSETPTVAVQVNNFIKKERDEFGI